MRDSACNEVVHVIQGAQAQDVVVARGLAVEVLDVPGVQARFRERRAQPGEALFVGIEAGVDDRARAQECTQLVAIELLSATHVEHPSAQTADVVGDPCFLTGERLPVDETEPSATAGAVRTRSRRRDREEPAACRS
jgi:hypothetical protein